MKKFELTTGDLFPQTSYPVPRNQETLASELPHDGRATAELPEFEIDFLEKLEKGSLVDVKWTRAEPDTRGRLGRRRTYRCRGVKITESTVASLWIGPMRFSRTTSHPVGKNDNKSLRIVSSGYEFYGEINEVEADQLPYGMRPRS